MKHATIRRTYKWGLVPALALFVVVLIDFFGNDAALTWWLLAFQALLFLLLFLLLFAGGSTQVLIDPDPYDDDPESISYGTENHP